MQRKLVAKIGNLFPELVVVVDNDCDNRRPRAGDLGGTCVVGFFDDVENFFALGNELQSVFLVNFVFAAGANQLDVCFFEAFEKNRDSRQIVDAIFQRVILRQNRARFFGRNANIRHQRVEADRARNRIIVPINEIVLDDRSDKAAENRGSDIVRVAFDQRRDSENFVFVEIQAGDFVRRHDSGDDASRARAKAAAKRKVCVEVDFQRRNGDPVVFERFFERRENEIFLGNDKLSFAAGNLDRVAASFEREAVKHVERDAHYVESWADICTCCGNGNFEFHFLGNAEF